MVGVAALIVVLGVMNGLRDDLRERILVANPHLRILTFGSGLRLDDWATRAHDNPARIPASWRRRRKSSPSRCSPRDATMRRR